MTLLICGSRVWTDKNFIYNSVYGVIREFIEKGTPITLAVTGRCPRGADLIGEEAAVSFGLPVKGYPAAWDTHGKAAGIIRNQEMLDKEKPDIVLAFAKPNLKGSRGTFHMVSIAKKAGVETRVYEKN
jgi:hypothetical protein